MSTESSGKVCPICGQPYIAVTNKDFNSTLVGMFIHQEKFQPNIFGWVYVESMVGCETGNKMYRMSDYA